MQVNKIEQKVITWERNCFDKYTVCGDRHQYWGILKHEKNKIEIGGKMFNTAWLTKGIDYYNDNNSSMERLKLEREADRFMYSPGDYDKYVQFLKEYFLRWMRSRSSKNLFLESVSKEGCIEQIFDATREDIDLDENVLRVRLKALCQNVNGVGPVLATAMITLANPQEYGIVNKYTIVALNKNTDSTFELNSIDDAVVVIKKMRKIREEILKNSNQKVDVRKVDMALWGYGRVKIAWETEN